MGNHDELFEKKNVIGYEERKDGIIVFVSQKQPEDELHPTDIVSPDLVDDVIDVQYGEEREGFDAKGHKSRQRPCVAGVSEMNERGTACTAGVLARVNGSSAPHTVSDNSLSEGDLVRVSNNHCLARENRAELGETIIQPSPMDYGTQDDRVGTLARYVPLRDGGTVDIAARTASDDELTSIYGLIDEVPRGKNYTPTRDLECTKSGRTTDVTEGKVLATHATIRVNYDDGVYVFENQIIGDVESIGGDSSSPVVTTEDGELVGILFAGSDTISVWNRIENVERELGVNILTEKDLPGDITEGNNTGEYTLSFQEAEGLVTSDVREIVDAINERDIDSMADLARTVDLSPSKVRYRLKKMESIGIIEFEKGNGNAKIPTFAYDRISIEPFTQ